MHELHEKRENYLLMLGIMRIPRKRRVAILLAIVRIPFVMPSATGNATSHDNSNSNGIPDINSVKLITTEA